MGAGVFPVGSLPPGAWAVAAGIRLSGCTGVPFSASPGRYGVGGGAEGAGILQAETVTVITKTARILRKINEKYLFIITSTSWFSREFKLPAPDPRSRQ